MALNWFKKLKIKYYVHNFKNDHGLDSGAWIKLIKSKNIKNLELFFKEHNCKAVIVRPDRFILSSCTSVKNFNSYLNKNLSLLA